jgi:hypothetical protein
LNFGIFDAKKALKMENAKPEWLLQILFWRRLRGLNAASRG